VAAAAERDTQPTPTDLITLTVNEFRRLFDALLLAGKRTLTSLLHWSHWRRQHRHRARQATTNDANTNDHDLRLQY
jgi:hypothetical protein